MTTGLPTAMPRVRWGRRELWQRIDPWIGAAALGLIGLGVVMVYSASAVRAGGAQYLILHLAAVGIGAVAAVATLQVPLERWSQFARPLLVLTLVALVLVFVPGVGRRVNGAQRWLALGPVSFQPAELAKLAVVVYLAWALAQKKERVASFWGGFVPISLAVAVTAGLVLVQPDLGTAAVLACTWVGMLFVAGIQLGLLVGTAALCLPVLAHYVLTHPHARARLLAYWNPEAHRSTFGYQVWESLVAFGSGGPFGVGVGRGDQKLYFLPESHTDFIFSVVGQELGFVGVLIVLGAYGVLLARTFSVGRRLPTRFARFLVFGIGLWLAVQAGIHMGVAMAVLPAKGLTLPLVSFGRSSLIVTMVAIAIVLRASAEVEAER